MAPEGAEPFHVGLVAGIAGQALEGLQDVVPPHLLKAPEQVAGVIQHDPRIAALRDQLGDDVAHAPIALGEHWGVVVITLAAVLLHVLQMGDQLPIGPGRNRGLVHVQRTGKGRLDLLQLQVGMGEEHRTVVLHQGKDLLFLAGDGGKGNHGKNGPGDGCKDRQGEQTPCRCPQARMASDWLLPPSLGPNLCRGADTFLVI